MMKKNPPMLKVKKYKKQASLHSGRRKAPPTTAIQA